MQQGGVSLTHMPNSFLAESQLLKQGLGLLWSIDLSGIALPMGAVRPLLDAIGPHLNRSQDPA